MLISVSTITLVLKVPTQQILDYSLEKRLNYKDFAKQASRSSTETKLRY